VSDLPVEERQKRPGYSPDEAVGRGETAAPERSLTGREVAHDVAPLQNRAPCAADGPHWPAGLRLAGKHRPFCAAKRGGAAQAEDRSAEASRVARQTPAGTVRPPAVCAGMRAAREPGQRPSERRKSAKVPLARCQQMSSYSDIGPERLRIGLMSSFSFKTGRRRLRGRK
jgi:hypothetical protein